MRTSSEATMDGINKNSTRIGKPQYFLVLVLTFLVNFDSTVAIPIISNYAISLGASVILASFIVGVYSMVHIPSNIIAGRFVDKIGRKRLIAIGILLDGISILLYSLARDPYFLLFARIIHGLGGGFGGPGTMAYLSDATPKEKSGRGMALYGISFGIALLFGFMIGGMGTESVGYNKLFFIVSIVLFIMTILSFILPKIYQPLEEKLSLKQEFKIFKETILSKKMIPPYLAIATLNFNLGIITATYSIILKSAGYTDGIIGMIFGVLVIFSIIVHYPSGLLSDKTGKRNILTIGLVFVSLSFLILIISTSLPIPIFGMIIFGVGHGMIFPTSAGIIKNNTKEHNRGMAMGTFYALVVAGIAIGAPVSGLFFDMFNTFAMLMMGVLIPLSISIILFLISKISSK
ncbi:MAG: MFS transporter [Promethearchaeota archaeon]|jgi:MFS family permease